MWVETEKMKEKTNKIRAVSQQEHSRWTSWEAVIKGLL